eukprot:scaffold90054_cov75-Phaeocystis_antarctica.AAC.13
MGTKPGLKYGFKLASLAPPAWPTKSKKRLNQVFPRDRILKQRSSLRGRTKVAKVGPPRASGMDGDSMLSCGICPLFFCAPLGILL